MFSPNCGQQADGYAVCPNCGIQLGVAPAPQPIFTGTAVAAKYNAAFSDKGFFVATLMFTIATVLSGMSIIPLLMSIFMWVTYSNAKKGKLSDSYLRYTSGCIFAQRIINWVGIGLFLLFAAAFGVFGVIALSEASYGYSSDATALGITLIICAAMYAVCAVLMIIENIWFYGNAHKFAKSLYTDLQYGYESNHKVGAIRGWLIFFAVSGILALVSIGGLVVIFMAIGSLAFGDIGLQNEIGMGMAQTGAFTAYLVFYVIIIGIAILAQIPAIVAYLSYASWLKKYFSK